MSARTNQYWAMLHSTQGPQWRLDYAQKQAASTTDSNVRTGDRILDDLIHILRLDAREQQQACDGNRRYATILSALHTWQSDRMREPLKIMLIGNCECGDIAARLGISLEVLEAVEKIAFDVRDMLTAPSWIHCHVIRHSLKTNDHQLAAKLKLAYVGGASAAIAMLDAESDVPSDEAERIYDAQLLLHSKFQEAAEQPLQIGEHMDMMKLYADFIAKGRELDVQKCAIESQCDLQLLRQERKKLELEINLLREKRRAEIHTRLRQQVQSARHNGRLSRLAVLKWKDTDCGTDQPSDTNHPVVRLYATSLSDRCNRAAGVSKACGY